MALTFPFLRTPVARALWPALLAASSWAAEPATALPPVTVRAEPGSTAPLATSAQAERERLERVPGGTNLVQPQQEARLATLRDALDYQPGIVIQDFFGATDQPRLSIRGSGIQSNPLNRGVLLLQDGLPLNEADGSFIIGLLEPRNTALVSVRRGANTLAPGATTLGGELDFQSLTGSDERGRARVETGSFGRHALQGAVGLQGGPWDGRISVSGDRFDGWRHHSASRRDALHANLGFKGDGGLENRSYLSWTDLHFDIPTVVPKERVYSNPQGIMGDGNTPQDQLLNVYRRDPHRTARQLRLANRTRWGDAALRHELGVYWQDTDDTFNNQTSYTLTRSRTTGAQWQATGQAGEALQWRTALAWSRSRMDRDLDATSPQTGAPLQRFGTYGLMADNLQAQAGADWRLAPAWTLAGQLGWSRQSRDAENLRNGQALNQQWNFATPKVGVNWAPTPATRWWANVSRSQEAPTFWEIVAATVAPNNPAGASSELVRLNLQRATTLEVGGQGRWGEGSHATQWTLAVYRSEVDDELMSTTDANGIKVGTYNYQGGTRHQGIEAGLSGSWPLGADASALQWRGAWTFSDFRFKGGEYAGNRIAGVPRHLLSAELLWRVHSGTGTWRVGPNLRWMPTDTPTDHANTPGSEQDAYALLGFKLEWQSGPWSAYLLAENLTDRRYASSYAIRNRATPDQPGYLPGLGRSVAAGVSYQF